MIDITTEQKNDFELKECFIAYFDILGYQNMIEKGKEDEIKKLLSIIDDSVKTTMVLAYSFNELGAKIKMRVFSDNFFLCTESDPYILIILISILQSVLAINNIFIRGSLCYGSIYFDGNYIFGKGLIDAYYLESKIAIFPRIIIDDTFEEGIKKTESQRLGTDSFVSIFEYIKDDIFIDFDNSRYINYLNSLKSYKEHEEKENNISDLSFETALCTHKEVIQKNLSNQSKHIRHKYEWCKQYHNRFCEENNYDDFVI